jgi:hypothetical protein
MALLFSFRWNFNYLFTAPLFLAFCFPFGLLSGRWVDKRKNWHVIGHAYDNMQFENCGSSTLSSHFFSTDGKSWNYTQVAPYSHTVQYDDGTSHTYTTLERPNLHFDASGQLTHINLAADLVTGDEGCASRTKHAHFGHTPCDNCKWDDHAGTTIIALDV